MSNIPGTNQPVSHYGSDTVLYKPPNSNTFDSPPPDFVSTRNKRPRNAEVSAEQFTTFKNEMKDLITQLITEQKKDFSSISNNLKELKESNTNIVNSISFLTSQNSEFQTKISTLEEQSRKDRDYIYILEEKIEDLSRSSRKSCVEIKNVPIKPQESRLDLINMTLNISRTIQLDIKDQDISDIFRLRNRKEPGKNSTVVVELRSPIQKSDFLKKAKEFNVRSKTRLQAKHLGFTANEDQPIFVSEQLTPKAARLFFLARDLAKSKHYKYCWTSFGRVFVRKDDQSKTTQIQNEAQVQHLMQEI